ncbi:hypothetical protein [Niallia sp. 03133]|uniref:hypothetical protein n=1 Tax=Niallia sp. 03133 TaxID=3458060 RepID=UPI0040440FAC
MDMSYLIGLLPYEWVSTSLENQVIRSSFIAIIAWGLFNLCSITTFLFPKLMSKLDINVDKMIIPFVTKLLKTLICMLGFRIKMYFCKKKNKHCIPMAKL